jgi:hypothetical protein
MTSRTLPPPALPDNLPTNAQWLAGEGAGSWFVLDLKSARILYAERFDPSGRLECAGSFKLLSERMPDLSIPLSVTYPSHCATVTLAQRDSVFKFARAVGPIG